MADQRIGKSVIVTDPTFPTQQLSVGGDGAIKVGGTGTFAVQVDGLALTSLQLIDDWDDGADRCKTIEAADVSLDGTTVATIKRFHVVTSTDGATVIAAVVGKKFRIRSLSIASSSNSRMTRTASLSARI